MSRSIRGDNCLTDVRRAKKLSGRLAHEHALARYNKRNSVLTTLSDSYQHTIKGALL